MVVDVDIIGDGVAEHDRHLIELLGDRSAERVRVCMLDTRSMNNVELEALNVDRPSS